MILSYPELENCIEFKSGKITSLVIENRIFFYHFLNDMIAQINGENGKFSLYDGEKQLRLADHMDFTDSFINFTLNRKSLQSKILSHLESLGTESENYLKTEELMMQIENYVDLLSEQLPCSLKCEKVTSGAVLKAIGLHICEEYDNPLEQIFDYMELIREFDSDKIFVFVNMRSYFSIEELTLFFQTVVSHEFQILLIDGFSDILLPNEERLTIDSDLCEF